MTTARRILLATLLIGGATCWAQPDRREPHIGYVYPAGGQQNTTFRVTVGGQNLRDVTDVHVTGAGVKAKVLRYYPPLRNVEREQRGLLIRTLRALIADRWEELHTEGRVGASPPWRELQLPSRGRPGGRGQDEAAASQPVELPPHPLLYDLESKSLRELLHVRHALLNLRKGQPNVQIAESVLIEVNIDAAAPPGEREIRLGGRPGLTNPMRFEVGVLPEICECEENDPGALSILPDEPPLELPLVINGQVMPGDVDRFQFAAREGQDLVIETHARRLIPYLADAVPGWFQATLVAYDADGHEVAFADDYRFDPDPVLLYRVPVSGVYTLEIRDSIYRGRDDFVYRITLGEQPFITSLFPLGTKARQKRYVEIQGWNLPTDRLSLDPGRESVGIRQRCVGVGKRVSNRVTFAVDDLPSVAEMEPNDTPENARRLALARIVDGRIATAGDVDMFQFKGKASDEIVAEITARRLNSPLDSLLRVIDSAGNVLAWNDDYEHKDGYLYTDTGLLTHSADSYLRVRLPADGVYFVQITDSQGQGGSAYGYRLRLGPPQPDFALRVTPSSISVGAGGAVPIAVHVLRKDGFDGDIGVVLADAPSGFKLGGALIPAGRDSLRMTLTAPRGRFEQPIPLRLEGKARIGGEVVSRPAVPAEDMMQAFLYRHLAPSQELLVAVRGLRLPAAEIAVVDPTPVRISAGGSVEVEFAVPKLLLARELEFELDHPPPGVTLEKVSKLPGGFRLVLKADAESAEVGLADNLILEGFTHVDRPQRGGDGKTQKVRVSAGFLPALPIVVTPSRVRD